jgi:predicted MFS family arabinose efflux permease
MFTLTALMALLLVVSLRGLRRPPAVRVLLGVLTPLPAAVESTGAGASVAGTVTAVYGAAVLGFARVVGPMAHRTRAPRLIALGESAAVAGCGLLILGRSPAPALRAAGLLGLAWVAMHSSLQTWATEVLPGVRATVVSAFAGALFLGSAVGAKLAGGFAEAHRYALIFGWATMLAVVLGLFATLGRARWIGSEGEPGP